MALKTYAGKEVAFRHSTTEQWTGRYDENGKKIYTILRTVNQNKNFIVYTTLASLGLSNIKDIRINEKDSRRQYSSTTTYPNAASSQSVNIYLNANDYSAAYINVDSNLVTISSNTGLYIKYTIIFEYTRTDR